jgi:hypothetical protein
MGSGLDGGGTILGRCKIFLFPIAFTPALTQWEPGAISLGVKRQGREANHSPPSSAEVKNDGDIPPPLQTSSWHSA